MDEYGVTPGQEPESSGQVVAFRELNVYVRCTYLEAADQDQLRGLNVKPVPNGLHILVSRSTGQVVEPVLLFLEGKLVRRLLLNKPNNLKKSPHTRKALADDLKDFYDFLDGNGLALDAVDDRALNTYVSTMESTPSPVTGQPYSSNTIIRRLSTVKMFCSWAQDRGLLRHRFLIEEVKARRSMDRRFLAHLPSTRKTERFAPAVDVPSAPDPSERVTVLASAEVKGILDALGPPVPLKCLGVPEAPIEGALHRDRLMAQCGFYVGLRREEVCDLELDRLNAIRVAEDTHPFTLQKILVHGKGNKWRTVNVPTWLILSLQYYAATERAEVAAKALKQDAAYVAPNRVFLNRADARTGRGAQVTPKTLNRIFREAQLRRNATCAIGAQAGSGEAPLYGFHVLRHSYAVYTYLERKRARDTDPIKYIQAQLGHAHYSTTADTYLKYALLAESRLYDVYLDARRLMTDMFEGDLDG
ncbi:hypothetical protein ASG87_12165 [Frateuria sp. Soil773]|uniref:tyrosine-type recombinase/integrase n=1 Tax=Frateuria sp. Soil773 TaxID=1736407 RepID=UPI0006F71D63|nr:tyrosine-type recombinase/integrase [Frateuria sp. Soil773]KRF01159.1 hypothetical protein ASG87_12165 [Frateuria sp. Soil773]